MKEMQLNLKIKKEGESMNHFYRPLSLIERSYIVKEPTNNYPFAVQLVCQGVGSLVRADWISAFEQVMKVNPVVCVKRHGKLKFSGLFVIEPDFNFLIQEHHQVAWSGNNGAFAHFLETDLDISLGQGFQILLIQGTVQDPSEKYIVFRVHHGLTDVGGLMIIMRNFFLALNGQALVPENSLVKDEDVLLKHRVKMQWFKKNAMAVAGVKPKGESLTWLWHREKILGKNDQLLIALMEAIDKASEAFNSEKKLMRFRITFDLRKYLDKDVVSTANLTNAFDIDLEPNVTRKALKAKIMAAFRARLPLQRIPKWLVFIANFLPEDWLAIKEPTMLKTHQKGRYFRTGTVSVLPKEINLTELSYNHFTCQSLFGIPGPYRILSCFIAAAQMPTHIELAIGMPEMLASQAELEKITQVIAQHLSSE
jgi:hypothetical protein